MAIMLPGQCVKNKGKTCRRDGGSSAPANWNGSPEGLIIADKKQPKAADTRPLWTKWGIFSRYTRYHSRMGISRSGLFFSTPENETRERQMENHIFCPPVEKNQAMSSKKHLRQNVIAYFDMIPDEAAPPLQRAYAHR